MQFIFKPMNEIYADAILNWHYEGSYAFYDMDQDAEDLEEFLDSHNWADKYYAALNEGNELIGFFSFSREEGGAVTIGLGLRPDHTGKGLGQAFVEAGLEFGQERFKPTLFRLSVAMFNQRAIRIYERIGFKPDEVFINETNAGQHEFLRMSRKI
jgi:[ribosomal protein S18]-alanine N-acetyltransferase